MKNKTGSSSALYSTEVQNLAPGKYTASAYVHTLGIITGDGYHLCLNLFKDNAYYTSYITPYTTESVSGWKRLSFSFTVPQGTTSAAAYAHIGICLAANMTGTVYIDDIQIEKGEIPNAYNLLENSSFQYDTSAWTYGNTPTVASISEFPDATVTKALRTMNTIRSAAKYTQMP